MRGNLIEAETASRPKAVELLEACLL
jgi:hypothetical protein